MLMSSCLGDSEEPHYTANLNYPCFNHVYKIADGNTTISAARYNMAIDFTTMSFDLSITGCFSTENTNISTLNLGTLNLTVNATGGYDFSAAELVSGETHISDLRGKMWVSTAIVDGVTQEVVLLSFSYYANGQYRITALNSQPYFYCSKTATTMPATEETEESVYETSSMSCQIALTSAEKASVYLDKAQFNARMPQMALVLKDIPITLNANGYSLDAESITPYTSNDIPVEAYTFKNLKINVTGTTMNMSFICPYNGLDCTVESTGSIFPKSN